MKKIMISLLEYNIRIRPRWRFWCGGCTLEQSPKGIKGFIIIILLSILPYSPFLSSSSSSYSQKESLRKTDDGLQNREENITNPFIFPLSITKVVPQVGHNYLSLSSNTLQQSKNLVV